jgi:hypothetical protein
MIVADEGSHGADLTAGKNIPSEITSEFQKLRQQTCMQNRHLLTVKTVCAAIACQVDTSRTQIDDEFFHRLNTQHGQLTSQDRTNHKTGQIGPRRNPVTTPTCADLNLMRN